MSRLRTSKITCDEAADRHSRVDLVLQWQRALSDAARAAMEDEAHERFISHAVPWEMAIKLALGKLQLQTDYGVIFPDVMDANGFQLLPAKLEHYRGLITLPRHHADPFDRLMISQAQLEELTIITCDEHFPAYGVPLLWQPLLSP